MNNWIFVAFVSVALAQIVDHEVRAEVSRVINALILVDNSLFKLHWNNSSDEEIKCYYETIISGTAKRLESIKEPAITVSMCGIYVIKNTCQANFIRYIPNQDPCIDTSASRKAFNKLDSLGNKYSLKDYDAVILYTRSEVSSIKVDAVLESLCGESVPLIFVNEDGLFMSIDATAHGLAYSLGSKRDGEENNCDSNHHHIMTNRRLEMTVASYDNHLAFSKCSVEYIKNFLAKKGSNCLAKSQCSQDEKCIIKDAGQRYSVVKQCRFAKGPDSDFCVNKCIPKKEKCKKTLCKNKSTKGDCEAVIPVDGTKCGSNQWCQDGKCVNIPGATGLASFRSDFTGSKSSVANSTEPYSKGSESIGSTRPVSEGLELTKLDSTRPDIAGPASTEPASARSDSSGHGSLKPDSTEPSSTRPKELESVGLDTTRSVSKVSESVGPSSRPDFSAPASTESEVTGPGSVSPLSKELESAGSSTTKSYSDAPTSTSPTSIGSDSKGSESVGVDYAGQSCWIKTVGFQLPGLKNIEINDPTQCLRRCLQTNGCKNVDWDHRNSSCWIQNGRIAFYTLYPQSSVTNYRLNRDCYKAVAGLVPAYLRCWEVRNQMQYEGKGLEHMSYINDLPTCIGICDTVSFCNAVDMDRSTNPPCWVQLKNTFVANERDLKYKKSATNYLRKEKCREVLAGLGKNCWTKTVGYQMPGLTYVMSKDLNHCLSLCLEKKDCNIVDWDEESNSRCWIQKQALKMDFKPKKSVINYQLDRKCYEEIFITDPPYMRCWVEKKYKYYPGLEQSENIDELPACIAKCDELGFCNVINMDRSSNPKCWLQTMNLSEAEDEKNLKYKANVTNYFRDENCRKLIAGADLTCWTMTYGHKLEGLAQLKMKDLSSCLDECISNTDCHAVDWHTEIENGCFLQTSKNLKVSKDKLKATSSVTNFILNRKCLGALFLDGSAKF